MNKHKIIEWCDDNGEYVNDRRNQYFLECKKVINENDKVFRDVIYDEAHDNFEREITNKCTSDLALNWDECYIVLEEYLGWYK